MTLDGLASAERWETDDYNHRWLSIAKRASSESLAGAPQKILSLFFLANDLNYSWHSGPIRMIMFWESCQSVLPSSIILLGKFLTGILRRVFGILLGSSLLDNTLLGRTLIGFLLMASTLIASILIRSTLMANVHRWAGEHLQKTKPKTAANSKATRSRKA